MREFEESVCSHRRTLEMTHKLQQAREEVLHPLSRARGHQQHLNPLASSLRPVSLLE